VSDLEYLGNDLAVGPLAEDRIAEVIVFTDGRIGLAIDDTLPTNLKIMVVDTLMECLTQARQILGEDES
jgi:hypothetical protein